MNKILLLLFLNLLSINNLFANTVPSCWLNTKNCNSANFAQTNTSGFNSELKNIFEFKSNLVENIANETPKNKKFHLNSIKTVLGIEITGEIGILESGGEAALELIWVKNKSKNNFLDGKEDDKKDENEFENEYLDNSNEINLSEKRSLIDAVPVVERLSNNLVQKGKLKNKELFKKNLLAELDKLLKVRESASFLEESQWNPYRFQIELYFEASGKIAAGPSIGGGFQLKFAFDIENKKHSNFISENQEQNLKFFRTFAESFENANKKFNSLNKNSRYELTNFKLGIALIGKGNIGIAKAKGGLGISVLFRKNKIRKSNFLNKMPNMLESISLVETNSGFVKNENKISSFNTNIVNNGLNELMNSAYLFASKADERENKFKRLGLFKNFNLDFIEIELEVFNSGSLGLVSIEGVSSLELYLTRKR